MHCNDVQHMREMCYGIGCPTGFKCQSAYCIPLRLVCDKYSDCPYGDDELNCSNFSCVSLLQCTASKVCIPPWEVCDGVVDCVGTHDDEIYCDECPDRCSCLGTALYCSGFHGTNIPDFTVHRHTYAVSIVNSSEAVVSNVIILKSNTLRQLIIISCPIRSFQSLHLVVILYCLYLFFLHGSFSLLCFFVVLKLLFPYLAFKVCFHLINAD